MIDHLYSPQMSDIFVRLLNFNKSVFRTTALIDSTDLASSLTQIDAEKPDSQKTSLDEGAAAEEVR